MLPFQTASCSGVAPSASRWFTSAPRAISAFTRSRSPDCTAWCRSADDKDRTMAAASAILSTHVLHLFFQLDAEGRAHQVFQLTDQEAEVGRRAAARVVKEVGVVGGHVNRAALH